MRVLRACLKWCLEYGGLLDKVPVQSKRHSLDTGQRQPNVLNPAQVAQLLASCLRVDPVSAVSVAQSRTTPSMRTLW